MHKVAVGAACALFAICGGPNGSMAYDIVDVQQGGIIAGRVAFQGDPPSPRVFEVNKDPELCGAERTLIDVDASNGWLKGAVIVLEGIAEGKPFPERSFREGSHGNGEFLYTAGEALSLEVRTKGCNFGPPTGVLSADQPVRFANSDPVKHTLHTYSSMGQNGLVLRTIHNRDIGPHSAVDRTFKANKLRDSRVVKVTCDRHDFMQNWFYVVETPYFAISDKTGNFTIDQVPPGRYELIAWHPVLGLDRQHVTVVADQTVEANFSFQRLDR